MLFIGLLHIICKYYHLIMLIVKGKEFVLLSILVFCEISLIVYYQLSPGTKNPMVQVDVRNFSIFDGKEINNWTTEEPLILIWKYGETLENRHIHRYHPKKRFSPFENCSAQCRLTYNSSDLKTADVILFHLHKMTKSDAEEIALISKTKRNNENQVWVFLTDESPVHTVIWPEYKNLFNWSMTYRSDSDVPVPYGRIIPRKLSSKNYTKILQEIDENLKNKTKLVAVMGSNCSANKNSGSSRWKYVESLSTILKIKNNSYYQLDIIGRCLNGNSTLCPGHFKSDCKNLNNYKFYLSFENSNCPEYLTEKLFWNAYSKYNIPIIMGPQKKDCEKLLPPNSFIHVKDFNSPELLIDYLIYLSNNEEKYLEYHNWRLEFDVINEHGYFGSASKHYCRLCEAFLHRDKKKKKTYSDIQHFWNKQECFYDL